MVVGGRGCGRVVGWVGRMVALRVGEWGVYTDELKCSFFPRTTATWNGRITETFTVV